MRYKMLMLIHTATEKQGPRYLPDSVTLHSTGHRPRSPLQVSAHPPSAASLWVVAFQPLCAAPCRRAAPHCHLPPSAKGSVLGAAVPIGQELAAHQCDSWRNSTQVTFSNISLLCFDLCLQDKALKIVLSFSPLSFRFYFLFANVIPLVTQPDRMHNATV